ncbi:MAG: GspE/PulE family protein [Thermostichales cyanobacterium DRC_bins_46]
MQTMLSDSGSPSVWQRLKNREIASVEEALRQLVSPEGKVRLEWLDDGVNQRFLESFPDKKALPHVLPLLIWQGTIHIGCPEPISQEALDFIQQRTGMRVQTTPIDQDSYRLWYKRQNLPSPDQISTFVPIDPFTGLPEEQQNIRVETELSLAQAESQRQRINALISNALRHRASDIHLEPTEKGLRVRYRIDGMLHDITTLAPALTRPVTAAIKVMSNMDIAESRRPQDGRIGQNYTVLGDNQTPIGASDLDMRVSSLPCVWGEKIVIRLLHRQDNMFTDLGSLGFDPRPLEIYKSWLQQPQGLIIFTGPTGSGKTSTLYTSLQLLAKEETNITTIEDPVEYVFPRITQTQVHEKAGMTFANGLRAILRQDPDVIMVGEIRDRETAETVVRAALTGHLVLSTLHTNDAPGAIPRIKDIGPDPGMISDALLGIVGQRLVRKVCPYCAEPYTPTEADLAALGLKPTPENTRSWRKGKGCKKCFNTGFLGREAVVELLHVDERIREIIYSGTMLELHRYLQQTEFFSFRLAAINKVIHGRTTLSEVQRVLPQSALLPWEQRPVPRS